MDAGFFAGSFTTPTLVFLYFTEFILNIFKSHRPDKPSRVKAFLTGFGASRQIAEETPGGFTG
jgi:hypothetical protein